MLIVVFLDNQPSTLKNLIKAKIEEIIKWEAATKHACRRGELKDLEELLETILDSERGN